MVDHITREHMKPLLEPYGLSEATRHGGLLFLGGQTGMSPQFQIVDGGLKAQALQAFRNIREIVEFAGGSMGRPDAPHLVSHRHGPQLHGGFAGGDGGAAGGAAGIRPGATAVRVKELLTPEILIEIQAVAAL